MLSQILILTIFITISICLSYINTLTRSKYSHLDSCYDCENDCRDLKKKNVKKPIKKEKKSIKIILK